MKLRKITINVNVEVLSVDAAPSILCRVADQIRDEITSGSIQADDGDLVNWSTSYGADTFI